MSSTQKSIVVWDPFVRVFHWSLVTAYILAWATADEGGGLHERVGYFVLALIGLRVVWGLVGSRHARFSDFVLGPRRTLAYLRSLLTGKATHYIGHNPIGGWMILALLLTLLATSVSGIQISNGGEVWEELHEGFGALSLLLLLGHVGGVLVSSALHQENLVGAMLTGRKTRRQNDV